MLNLFLDLCFFFLFFFSWKAFKKPTKQRSGTSVRERREKQEEESAGEIYALVL